MAAAEQLSMSVGKKSACEVLQVPRATFYRYVHPGARSQKEVCLIFIDIYRVQEIC